MSGPPSSDVSGRLILFGLLAVLLGALGVLLGLLQLLLPLLADLLPDPQAVASDPRTAVMGAGVYALVGGALAFAGIGSMRRRRWTRPVMLMLAWTWLIGGVLSLALVWFTLDELLALATSGTTTPGPAFERVFTAAVLAVSAAGGVALPGAFILVYRDERVRETCERHDPHPDWSDRCPTTVLALSLGLWAGAALCLPLLLRPMVPLFGRVVTGWPATLLLVAAAALGAWLGRSLFRLEPRGWWATLVLLVVVGASLVWTFLVVEPTELYRAMGYPEAQLAVLEQSGALGSALSIWSTVLLTLLSVVYMLAVRRHFVGGPGGPGREADAT